MIRQGAEQGKRQRLDAAFFVDGFDGMGRNRSPLYQLVHVTVPRKIISICILLIQTEEKRYFRMIGENPIPHSIFLVIYFTYFIRVLKIDSGLVAVIQ